MTAITLLDETTLRSIIRDETTRVVAESLPGVFRQATMKPYLTNDEVAELTGWSKRQLANRRKSGSLPYTKRGRTVLYRTEDVEAFLAAGYVPSSTNGRAADRPALGLND